MLRAAPFLLAALVLTACGGGSAPATTAAEPLSGDIAVLVEHVVTLRPDPWHEISEEGFRAAAAELDAAWPELDANGRLVELMRLLVLLGPRDGHSGIFPLDDAHEQELTLYPLRLYAFPEGLFVVSAEDEALVGLELVAVAGRPVDEVLALVEPLVPRDNEQSRAARAPQWLVTAEVLTGLGVLTSRTTFSAAANLLAELERDAEPFLVGEPTGGSPNLTATRSTFFSRRPASPRTSRASTGSSRRPTKSGSRSSRTSRSSSRPGTTSRAATRCSRLRSVERLVDERVRELVVLAADGGELDALKPPRQPPRILPETAERLVLHLVLAAHLLHEKLGVGDDLELLHAQLDRPLEAREERAVLRHVVRRRADRLAARVEHRPVRRLEDVAVRGRPRVPARAAVRREPSPHAGGSASGYRSNAGSSYGCASRRARTTSASSSSG